MNLQSYFSRIVGASYRDSSGYVFCENGVFKRIVTVHGKADYEYFNSSGLYTRLVRESLLLAHEEEFTSIEDSPAAYKVLIPEQIGCISYPYEWSFGQLRDAALLTLRIQSLALEHGMSLKDASAFNIQFRGVRPVFIDTLSFVVNDGGPWPAYNQFCRHFLSPLLLMARVSPDLNQFWKASLDGFPLELVSRLLPKSTYLNFGVLVHIHLHARLQRKYADPRKRVSYARFASVAGPDRKGALAESLRSTVAGLKVRGDRSAWVRYYQEADHYSMGAEWTKKAMVSRLIERIRPRLICDLGGNVGEYSRLGTKQGVDCVCFDMDPWCVHTNYEKSLANDDAHMLPLVMDLTNPSPSLGFNLEERLNFLERFKPDLILVLALIHHLRFTGNVPLFRIAELLVRLGEHLLIEFVPKDDVMVQALLRIRQDTFFDYNNEVLLQSFQEYCSLEEEVQVPGTDRILYYFRRKNESVVRRSKV